MDMEQIIALAVDVTIDAQHTLADWYGLEWAHENLDRVTQYAMACVEDAIRMAVQ